MFRRLTRWLLGEPIHVVSVTSVVNQNDPKEFFFVVAAVHALDDLESKFGLTFNLAALSSMNGVLLPDGRDDITCLRFTNGDQFYALMDIDDVLEMIGMNDDDEDDDDDEDGDDSTPTPTTPVARDDNDDPEPITPYDFQEMMKPQPLEPLSGDE